MSEESEIPTLRDDIASLLLDTVARAWGGDFDDDWSDKNREMALIQADAVLAHRAFAIMEAVDNEPDDDEEAMSDYQLGIRSGHNEAFNRLQAITGVPS